MNWFRNSIGILLILLSGSTIFEGCQNNTSELVPSDSLVTNGYAQDAQNQWQDSQQTITRSRTNAITEAVDKVSPAVVGINVIQLQTVVRSHPLYSDPFFRQFMPRQYLERVYEREVKSLGSGFIVSRDGYIVTNEHVVHRATKIVVTMTDGRHLTADLIGSDPESDIALLKVEGDDFPYVKFGNSDELIVGEWAIAFGNPFGLVEINDQPTVTVGVISALDRDWGRHDEKLYLDMIQTDAAINHGNSGGPLVNSLAEVIGMNTFIYTAGGGSEGSIGIGFAIPINKINDIITQIRETGKVDRDYKLGILDVSSMNRYIARAYGLNVNEGVIISQLEPGGPAYKAGMREEDVILGVAGKHIKNSQDFVQTLHNQDLQVGSVITFRVLRGNNEFDLDVTLEKQDTDD